jgi:hypothetical protein
MVRNSNDLATQAIPHDSSAKKRLVPRRGSRKTKEGGTAIGGFGTLHLCNAVVPYFSSQSPYTL